MASIVTDRYVAAAAFAADIQMKHGGVKAKVFSWTILWIVWNFFAYSAYTDIVSTKNTTFWTSSILFVRGERGNGKPETQDCNGNRCRKHVN